MGLFFILICLELFGLVFYKQEWVGKDGKLFYLYKFCFMKIDVEKLGVVWVLKKDFCVIKVGVFIRRICIDELLQLLNVLWGEMSLIGLCFEWFVFMEQFQVEIFGFMEWLVVKFGLSGWVQVNGGYDMILREKLMFDLYYI